MNYDVFISCKSEDYNYAQEVYDYLGSMGYKVFWAQAELGRRGDSRFNSVIMKALDASTHLVVLASKVEYLLTPYVEFEWSSFHGMIISGQKQGNLLTIFKDIDIKDPDVYKQIPLGLRFNESIKYDDYKKVVNYIGLNREKKGSEPTATAATSENTSAIHSKRYKIGDYYDDGRRRGVVFQVFDGGLHGKIVSLDQALLEWCPEEYSVGCETLDAISMDDGVANSTVVAAHPNSAHFKAVMWCISKGEGWYLPAINELRKFTLNRRDVHHAINETIKAHGGTPLYNIGDNEVYWSSTEYNGFMVPSAYVIKMSKCGTEGYGYKKSPLYVRAIYKF